VLFVVLAVPTGGGGETNVIEVETAEIAEVEGVEESVDAVETEFGRLAIFDPEVVEDDCPAP